MAYGIKYRKVEQRGELAAAVDEMFADDAPFIMDVHVCEEANVMTMIPPGKGLGDIMLNENEWYR